MQKNNKFIVIAGPCIVESKELLEVTAKTLSDICSKHDINFVFKSSYKKANRTSAKSFTGIGDELALNYLHEIGIKYKVKILTDVHTVEEVDMASDYVGILQIPAFLSRQTELIQAAAKTGKIVNIKKGQFMAPEDMEKAAQKVREVSDSEVWLTERGVSFGYHDLIVDFRSFIEMKKYGFPVIFDATHSQQRPSLGEQSGGTPENIIQMANAAAAIGIDGIFFETHPDPSKALSDSATQLKLSLAEELITSVIRFHELYNELQKK